MDSTSAYQEAKDDNMHLLCMMLRVMQLYLEILATVSPILMALSFQFSPEDDLTVMLSRVLCTWYCQFIFMFGSLHLHRKIWPASSRLSLQYRYDALLIANVIATGALLLTSVIYLIKYLFRWS